MGLSSCTVTSIGVILEKIYVAILTHVLQTGQDWCIPSIIKGALLVERFTFESVSWVPLNRFAYKFIHPTLTGIAESGESFVAVR
jgi:hypothetical protein